MEDCTLFFIYSRTYIKQLLELLAPNIVFVSNSELCVCNAVVCACNAVVCACNASSHLACCGINVCVCMCVCMTQKCSGLYRFVWRVGVVVSRGSLRWVEERWVRRPLLYCSNSSLDITSLNIT